MTCIYACVRGRGVLQEDDHQPTHHDDDPQHPEPLHATGVRAGAGPAGLRWHLRLHVPCES